MALYQQAGELAAIIRKWKEMEDPEKWINGRHTKNTKMGG
jgi:hypothetical protein